tara:strand:+ start:540 stop:1229 length:690 start_codon:yes stop_codon:yes gene_type:complete
MVNYMEYLSGTSGGMLSNQGWDTLNMWALDEALQAEAAEIIDLNTPQVIPFGGEWEEIVDLNTPQAQVIPFFEKVVAVDEEPKFITQSIYDKVWSGAEIQKDEEIARAGEEYKKALLAAAADFLSGGGMLSVKESKPKDEGRRKPVKIENLRGAKPGWQMAEGSNFWSVNEKDPYWKTKAGYKEAMDLYGVKPSWVKESSLEYNPTTGKYDPIAKEEFVNLQPTKRISL